MANNYTISNVVTAVSSGDSVASGTISSTADLFITPNAGYVVQASDFSIGDSLPAEVISVVFTDTVSALNPTNKVKATVTLASWYTMPNSATSIDIDIDGATQTNNTRLNYNTNVTTVSNVTQTSSIYTGTSVATVVGGGLTTYANYIDIPVNRRSLIYRRTIVADSGYHFAFIPSYKLSSKNASKWSSIVTYTAYNSQNQLTSIGYSLYYDMGADDVPARLGEAFTWDVPVVKADEVSYANISSVYYDNYKNNSVVPSNERTFRLNVEGSQDSTYNIKIEDDNGLTYDFNTDTFTRSLTTSDNQTIYSPRKQVSKSNTVVARSSRKNTHLILIPSTRKGIPGSNYFTTTITPTGSTKSSPSGGSVEAYSVRLYQLGDVDYSLSVSPGTYGVNVSDTAIKTLTNKIPLSTLTTFSPTDFPTLNTNNNGYFTSSQALGYTVVGTVSSHTHASTDVTLTATHASLKLQVGDTVTGVGVDSGATIASFPDTTIIRLSATSTGTISGDLTFQRTVAISRQPSEDDIIYTSPFSHTGIAHVVNYEVDEDTSNSSLVKIIDGDGGTFTDLTVGMLVQGDDILGHPTISSISTSGDLVLSTSQTLTAGSSLRFSVGGSELKISSMEVTGAGTSSAKLNISGYVERMGVANVIAYLNLANFVVAYLAPTAVATTATCPLGGSVTIKPLSLIDRYTETIKIASVAQPGKAGQATLASDGQEIVYAAPTSGSSETITYTVNDGINTSGSANIVITYTS